MLEHSKGGVTLGELMPRRAEPNDHCLGVLDHLHEYSHWTMRPYKLQRSQQNRITAICTNSQCLFRFTAATTSKSSGKFVVKCLCPHSCKTDEVVLRGKRQKMTLLPSAAETIITQTVAVRCSGGGGGISRKIQSAVKEKTGLDVDRRQINRLRQSTSPDVFNLVLNKLQVLPAMLNQIRGQLPEVAAVLHTSEISPQLTTAANHAFAMLHKNIGCSSVVLDNDKKEERSIQSLFFGEKDVVCHLEKSIGHSVYTADACHMDKNGVGYNCIALIITRRLGNGKIFIPAFCLTVLDESTEAWSNFFRFCISLGMDLTNPDSVLVSDMAKGLKSACMALGIQSRECLTHIFHRLQDELDCFSKGKNYSMSAFFKYAKATTVEEEHFRLQVLIDQHLRPGKIAVFTIYWEGHEAQVSAQSALNNGLELLDTFTSNNSETMNSSASVNVAFDARRALPWVDYVTTYLSQTRSFFFTGFQSNTLNMNTQGETGITEYAQGRIAANANKGLRQFRVVTHRAEFMKKPTVITNPRAATATTSISLYILR